MPDGDLLTAVAADPAPAPGPRAPLPGGTGLRSLFESAAPLGPTRHGLPLELARLYDGDLDIPLRPDRPTLVANFVETLDGAVALRAQGGGIEPGDIQGGGRAVSGGSTADELFLTVAPQLAGRDAGSRHLALVEGVAIWPDRAAWATLASARLSGDHLFLRYRLAPGGGSGRRA